MAMPMVGMPSNWKAEGLLGGLYGGMQAQYQSDAMQDATRQADIEYAMKQHDLKQKLADEPAIEAERAARITKANEYNTLSPTRIEGATNELEDKKWTMAEKKKIARTAEQAEFFAGLPQALEEAKAGGPAAHRAVWQDHYNKGKALGIDIGAEWNMDTDARLKANYQKALSSLPHLREMAKVAAQGDIQKTINRENAGSHEYIQRMKDIADADEGNKNRANQLEIAKLRGDATVGAAQARNTGYKPKSFVETLQIKAANGEQLNPYEQKLVDNAEFVAIFKAINPGTNPDVQLSALARNAAEPGPGQEEAIKKYDAAVAGVVKAAKDAVAQVQRTNSAPETAPNSVPTKDVNSNIKIGKDGKTKYRQIPGTVGNKQEHWEVVQ